MCALGGGGGAAAACDLVVQMVVGEGAGPGESQVAQEVLLQEEGVGLESADAADVDGRHIPGCGRRDCGDALYLEAAIFGGRGGY